MILGLSSYLLTSRSCLISTSSTSRSIVSNKPHRKLRLLNRRLKIRSHSVTPNFKSWWFRMGNNRIIALKSSGKRPYQLIFWSKFRWCRRGKTSMKCPTTILGSICILMIPLQALGLSCCRRRQTRITCPLQIWNKSCFYKLTKGMCLIMIKSQSWNCNNQFLPLRRAFWEGTTIPLSPQNKIIKKIIKLYKVLRIKWLLCRQFCQRPGRIFKTKRVSISNRYRKRMWGLVKCHPQWFWTLKSFRIWKGWLEIWMRKASLMTARSPKI